MAEAVKRALTRAMPWYDGQAERRETARIAALVHRAEVTRRNAIQRAYQEASRRMQR